MSLAAEKRNASPKAPSGLSSCRMETAPHRRGLHFQRITIPQENLQLMSVQREDRLPLALGPPAEAPGREPLLIEDKTLPVIDQNLNRLAPTASENKDRTAHRLLVELLPAERRQAIDPTAKVCRLHGHPDPHLGSDLDHRLRLQKA